MNDLTPNEINLNIAVNATVKVLLKAKELLKTDYENHNPSGCAECLLLKLLRCLSAEEKEKFLEENGKVIIEMNEKIKAVTYSMTARE